MKIKDVIISEKVNKGTAAGYKGSAGAQAIAQASGIQDVNQIKVGQVIKIPNAQGGTTNYTVKSGDTLDKIAAANKVAAPAAPTAAAPADSTNTASAQQSAASDAAKANAIAGPQTAQQAEPDTRGAAAMASKSASTQTSDQIATAALNAENPAPPDVRGAAAMASKSKTSAADTDAGDQMTSNYTGQDQRTANARPSDDTPSDQATANQTQTSNYTGQDQRTANARDANAAPPVQGYTGQQAQVQTFGQEDPARLQQLAGMNQTSNYTGQDQRTANARDDGQAAQPRDASTVPPAALGQRTSPEVSADTGLSTTPGELKSTYGTTNVKTASQDEYAWRAKNPNWTTTGAQYPGAGNWDPKTGRSKKDIEQGQKNADAVKGFFNKLNPFAKKEPTVNIGPGSPGYTANPEIDNLTPAEVNKRLKDNSSPQGQAGQTASPGGSMGNLTPDQINLINKNFGPKESLELDTIKFLSGLK